MSIAFLGAMKNWEHDELEQALSAMTEISIPKRAAKNPTLPLQLQNVSQKCCNVGAGVRPYQGRPLKSFSARRLKYSGVRWHRCKSGAGG
jgi:hypothetical protein